LRKPRINEQKRRIIVKKTVLEYLFRPIPKLLPGRENIHFLSRPQKADIVWFFE
jgi:hypothetical protein